MFPLVASFTGAWIETAWLLEIWLFRPMSHPLRVRGLKLRSGCRTICQIVASFTGAWIETMLFLRHLSVLLVASFTGAWIETYSPFILYWKSLQSHPLRVRGLKPVREKYTGLSQRRILYGCVDWNKSRIYPHRKFDESHPLRVRGLKPYITYLEIQAYVVASFTGAWIETVWNKEHRYAGKVASFTGAWIETFSI